MNPNDRRTFLESLGLLTLAGLNPPASAEEPSAPADLPRELAPSRADMGTLFPDIRRLAGPEEYPLSFLNERFRDVEEFKKLGRDKVLELLQYQPQAVQPRAEVIDRRDRGDYIQEKIVFSTSPTFRVPAYVLIPKGLKGPAPAIVDLHSHGGMFLFGKEKVLDLGRNHPAMTEYHRRNYDGRPTASFWAKNGYVVITIDAFMFGERRVLMDADHKFGYDRSRYSLDDVRTLNQVCRGRESTLAKSMVFAGLTWPGLVFWDDMRTVDYLITRPEVDPRRIGCVGISMGGYRSIFLAGLDSRIKAGCIVGFMSTVRPMLQAHVDTHSWVHYLPGLHRFLDWPDIASLHAPLPLMVQQCAQDRLFPMEGMKESLRKIEMAYRKAGAGERFQGRFYEEPHLFTQPMQNDALAWFDRHLK